MKLVIFPGSASPNNSLYRGVYGLIQRRASEFGYSEVDCSLRWPGHFDQNGKSDSNFITLEGAVAEAGAKIAELERDGQPYHILARSFGNYVAAKTILLAKPKLVQRLLLWAPPPYWVLWRMFVRDERETRQIANEKWLAFDGSFFPSIIPLETMLPQLEIECVAATGGADKYCRFEYLVYLRSLVQRSPFIVRDEVSGAPHEVHEDLPPAVVDSYLKALLAAPQSGVR
ncbi:MAG TPA: hypothetical protein VHC20_05430 [Candidatus Paceibacterota bacterium]|nr:hypothetical protein [Candidatus Paceibacterota bacterium]